MKGKFMEYEWDLMEYGILAIKHGWTIPPNGHVETSSERNHRYANAGELRIAIAMNQRVYQPIFNIPLHLYSVPVIPPFFLVQSEIPSNFGMTWGFSSEMEKPPLVDHFSGTPGVFHIYVSYPQVTLDLRPGQPMLNGSPMKN